MRTPATEHAKQGKEARLEQLLKSYNIEPISIGIVSNKRRIVMSRAGKAVVDLDLDLARNAWTTGLVEAMR